ncbi:MAG: ABC transporter substrate-binding protein [Epulopiscium sp.]|nr:ABC transporter substrate-binding protein [Candidatus Epulonipiscium sp.]
MKKTILAFTLVIILFLGGCLAPSKKGEVETENTSYPLIITDQLGREVTIEEEPERIVSGYYISTSLLIALDLQDQIVGIENKPEKRPIYKLAAPRLLQRPNVGTMKELNMEMVLELEPDLVILPVKLKDNIEALEELGIKVIAVNPENSDLINEMIAIISKATNTIDRGDRLVEAIDRYTKKLGTLLDGIDEKTVYLGGNSEFLNTAGSKMYQDTLITLARGKNVATEIEDSYWVNVSYEQLLKWDPDVIILASEAEYSKDDVLNDTAIRDIKAVKNKAVEVIPNNIEAWDSPVPSSVLGSLWMASVLYPDKYSNEEFNLDVQEFYSTFYNIEVNVNE